MTPERRDRVTSGQLRATGGDGAPLVLEGTAIRYESPTLLAPGWRETIKRGAARRALDDARDLTLLAHHDQARPLARRGRNLTVTEDEHGVHFRAELPATQEAKDIHLLAREGVIAGMSFGFSPQQGGKVDTVRDADGTSHDLVRDVGRLWEISAVTDPAYPSTTISARSRAALQRLSKKDPTMPTSSTKTTDALKKRADRVSSLLGLDGSGEPAAARRPPALTTQVRQVPAYGEGSPHSWFYDKWRLAVENDTTIPAGLRGDGKLETPFAPASMSGRLDPRSIRERLGSVETRAGVTTVLGAGGEFAAAPHQVADAFAAAARATGVIAPLFTQRPIELGTGDIVQAVKLTTGMSSAIQATEGSAPSSTDPVTSLSTSPVRTISGDVIASWQILDLSAAPAVDVAIAEELGRATAAALDLQLLSGTGSSGQLTGLLNVAGTTAVTYTDASPRSQSCSSRSRRPRRRAPRTAVSPRRTCFVAPSGSSGSRRNSIRRTGRS